MQSIEGNVKSLFEAQGVHEIKIDALMKGRDNDKKGIKGIFGSRNMDLKPEKFEGESAGKSFRSWSTDMVTFV
eukprot:3115958-Karenia_brevis.AAC.1